MSSPADISGETSDYFLTFRVEGDPALHQKQWWRALACCKIKCKRNFPTATRQMWYGTPSFATTICFVISSNRTAELAGVRERGHLRYLQRCRRVRLL